MLNSPLQTDWHEFQCAPSTQNLATLLRPRYKRLQFEFASHLAQSVGPGAPVGLGEGAKPDAPAFLVAVRQKKWRPEKAAILITADLLDYFAVSFGTEKLPPES